MKPQIVHRYAIPLQAVIERLIGMEAADGEAFNVTVEDDDLVVEIIDPRTQGPQTPAGEKIRTAQGDAMETVPVTGQPPVGTVSPSNETAKGDAAPEKPKGGPLAQRAGIICAEKGFWRFLAEAYQATGVDSADAAATLLRAECGITSRSELDHHAKAGETFRGIESKYRMWLEGY
jgi:hypothetical protein